MNSCLIESKVTVIHDSYFWALIKPLNFIVVRGGGGPKNYVFCAWGYAGVRSVVKSSPKNQWLNQRMRVHNRTEPKRVYRLLHTRLESPGWFRLMAKKCSYSIIMIDFFLFSLVYFASTNENKSVGKRHISIYVRVWLSLQLDAPITLGAGAAVHLAS